MLAIPHILKEDEAHLHGDGKVQRLVDSEELGLQEYEDAVHNEAGEIPDRGQATGKKAPAPQLKVEYLLQKSQSGFHLQVISQWR